MVEGIRKFYNDKTIFITGASGFMGKVLLEKLLYSCSDLKEVFILMRPKRGKSGAERVEEMTKLPLFQRIRDEKPDILKKIVPLFGDITLKRLGLNDDQFKQLISTTQVAFHLAATLKLESTLKPAVEMNLQGTQNVIDVCKSMTKLLVLVHLSTAFCNGDQDILYEEVYDCPHDPIDLMRCAEWMTEDTMNIMGNRMMAPHPNTYTYTKRLAEVLVRNEFPNLPLCIVRPSIVTPAYQEPLPGWVDSLNGPIGIMVAGGKGVIRSMICEAEFGAEVIPVDHAINGLIGIAYTVGCMKQKPEKIPVYNIICAEKSRLTWGAVLNEGKRVNLEYPFEAGLWYPNGDITTNVVKHYVTVAITQWLPALLIDFLMMIFFQPRFMIRIQKRIYVGLLVLEYFTTRQWIFCSDNFKSVFNKLTSEEQEIFYMSTADIDTLAYLKSIILGGRVYCLKEPLSTMKKARIQLKIQRVLDLGLKAFWIYLFVKLILTWSGYNQSLFTKH